MREILFRSKRTDNGEWIEGYVYRISEKLNPFIMLKNRHSESYQVFIETVGQYTGMNDINGNKIYEGDIVAHYTEGGGIGYYSKVVFNQEKGAFEFVCIEHPVIETFDGLANSDIGVVGNIHENPELLGGEK